MFVKIRLKVERMDPVYNFCTGEIASEDSLRWVNLRENVHVPNEILGDDHENCCWRTRLMTREVQMGCQEVMMMQIQGQRINFTSIHDPNFLIIWNVRRGWEDILWRWCRWRTTSYSKAAVFVSRSENVGKGKQVKKDFHFRSVSTRRKVNKVSLHKCDAMKLLSASF